MASSATHRGSSREQQAFAQDQFNFSFKQRSGSTRKRETYQVQEHISQEDESPSPFDHSN